MRKFLLLSFWFLFSCIALSQISLTPTITHVTCFGLSNGSASITATGGTGAYTYTWLPTGTNTAGITSLSAGTYTVLVEDATSNTASLTLTINQPAQLGAIVNHNNARCFGTATGTLSVAGTGGVAPYSFFWQSLSSNAAVVPNVPSGIYSVIVTDANNCAITETVNVTEPTQIMATVTQTNASCFGSCDGAFNVLATGGTPAYTFSTNLVFSNSYNSNVCPGTYTITINDANNCSYTRAVTITGSPNFSVTASITDAHCGQADGSACLSITGGNFPFSYIWNNATTLSCLNNVPAGVYTATVSDGNGCITTTTAGVNNLNGPLLSVTSQTNVSCFGLFDGAASVSVSGGTAPFSFIWLTGQTTSTANNLGAGIHYVSVTDANACVATTSVNITQPPKLYAQIMITTPLCSSGCNGSLFANATGGTTGYTYAWTGTSGNSQTVTNLCAGNYGVIITDNSGCSATNSITLYQQLPISISGSYTNVSCGSTCDGAASFVITGGNPVFYYTWLPAQPGNFSYASNLCPGSYTFNVTDASGCSSTNTFVINNNPNLAIPNATLTSLSTNQSCLQAHDGSIDLTVSGTNTGPFTYAWSNGAQTQDIYNLNSGVYTVIAFDTNMNCLRLTDTINTDGTNCGSISGNTFIDLNGDCIKNSGDNNLANSMIIINPGNRIGYSNASGDYFINSLPYGTYTITAYNNNTLLTQTCTTTINTQVNSGTPNSINNNFSFSTNSPAQPDLNVSAYSNGIVPGFVCQVNYNLSNYSYYGTSGVFKAILPTALIANIVSAPAGYTLSGDTILWNFNIVNSSYTSQIYQYQVTFTVPVNTVLGSSFSTCMWAQPAISDLNYNNNYNCYSRFVTGSFDPNDKAVNPTGTGPFGDISATTTDLTYLIRFQNTGNGPAVNIVVKDTLSPNLDISTLEILSSSHNYQLEILPGNVLKWKFNTIMLPDSGSNEPGSHGYIHYHIKRNSNNNPGTQIKNTAYIYFDFNEPVITNTTLNTIETITAITEHASDYYFIVYPNPANNLLNLYFIFQGKAMIKITDILGREVLSRDFNNQVDISSLEKGIYSISIQQNNRTVVSKIIIKE